MNMDTNKNIEKISCAELCRQLVGNKSHFCTLQHVVNNNARGDIDHEAAKMWLSRCVDYFEGPSAPQELTWRTATAKSYGVLFSSGSGLHVNDKHEEMNCYRCGRYLCWEEINYNWDEYYHTIIVYKLA